MDIRIRVIASIVIPVYNERNMPGSALERALAAPPPGCGKEAVVADDDSTGGTAQGKAAD